MSLSATPAEIASRALADHLAALPAAQLLSRYAATRDAQAFAGLVHQFGPLVLGTCRRVLGPSPDADDAFQAVFLALSRQAGSFRDPHALPAWLHRVSLRVSRKALARRASEPLRGLTPPGSPEPVDPTDPFADVAWKDVRRVLDEEIDALPEKYRGPVVLCWLDGLTQDEAAGKLGLSLNTLKRRLDAGRELLRSRLLRRGVAPVLVTAVVATPTGLRAVVPESLKALAVELGVGGAVPDGVAALEVVVAATVPARKYLKVGFALALIGGVATAGVVMLSDDPPPPGVRAEAPAEPTPPKDDKPEPAPPPRAAGPRPLSIPRNRMVHDSVGVGMGAFITFSPDGNTLAISGTWVSNSRRTETLFKQWDVMTGRELDTLKLPPGRAEAVAYSPDGRTVAVQFKVWGAGVDRRLFLFDLATGQERFAAATADLRVLAFSPDGKLLAGVSPSPRLYDVEKEEGRAALKEAIKDRNDGQNGNGTHVAFSRDGSTLATTCPGGIRLCDPNTGAQKAVIDPHLMSGFALSPDGKALAAVFSKTIKLWDLEAKPGPPEWLQVDEGSFQCVAFSPDGRLLATGGDDKRVRLWNLKTRKELAVLNGHLRSVTCVAFRPDGKTLASASADGTVKLWDIETLKELGAIRGPVELAGDVRWVLYHPDGKSLFFARHVTANGYAEIVHWHLATEKALPTFKDEMKSHAETFAAVISHDGSTLVAGTTGQIKFWNLGTGRVVKTLEWLHPSGQSGLEPYHLAYTRDGKTLVTGTTGAIALWDVERGAVRARIGTPGSGLLRPYTLSPDGRRLLVRNEGKLRVVDVETAEVRKSFDPALDCPAFSPDGKTLAVGSRRRVKTESGDALVYEIKFLDAETFEEKATIDAGTHTFYHLAYSPDGKTLASQAKDAIVLWDAATGRKRETLNIPTTQTGCLVFSPDNRTLVTGVLGDRTKLLFWDVSPEG